MKIAFDLRRIHNPGIGRYMKGLAEAVMAHAPQYEYLLVLPPGQEHLVTARSAEKITPRLTYYSVREQLELPAILRRYKVDLLHAPHFLLPLLSSCPAVATIHDVIYLACPQDLPSLTGRLYYRLMMHAGARRAERIITDSEFSRRDIARWLNVDPAKIDVIYPGVASIFQPVNDPAQLAAIRGLFGIEHDYFLCVGIYKPRKNHAGLLRAFRRFLAMGGRAQLVIAGPLTADGERQVRELAAEIGVARNVVLAGFVSESSLPALYSGARACACPSLYEGFGFTALEAMACGTPVVCTRATALPEVAGAGALYADPHNTEEFAERLLQICMEPGTRSALVEKGRANLRRFSWTHAAEQTVRVYEQAMRAPLRKTAYA